MHHIKETTIEYKRHMVRDKVKRQYELIINSLVCIKKFFQLIFFWKEIFEHVHGVSCDYKIFSKCHIK